MAINLLVCALPFNTHPQTHCLTKFAKCIFWLQHFYLGKMPELSASKDFSPFLANLPKKHQRELLIFSLVLIQLISPHFLSFLLRKLTFNKSDSYQVPATCQHQHRSQYELQFSPFLYKHPFFVVLLTTQVPVRCASLLRSFLGDYEPRLVHRTMSYLESTFGYYCELHSFFSPLITQYTSYQGNLILYLICKRKPRR